MAIEHVERLVDARQRIVTFGWAYDQPRGDFGAVTAVASLRDPMTPEEFRFSHECSQYIIRAAQENPDFATWGEPEKHEAGVRFAVWERAQGSKKVVLDILTRAIELAEAEA